ncbi:hypothetical protein HII31_02087 [Pseudocercospora fuligena]|uniref:F-box domain-containing protein n=1 Tax=Pseudocercospora fuligena TaxID=685502 RepID=A0A8H6RTR5_9PEZI|nr:hypothetical protein HII31_02087 [Pseudocercospora fuligena]
MKPPPSTVPNDLATLVQDLPKELFDEIFELVTQVESDEVITITKAYRHPTALQISSAIRCEKAKIYYTTNKFTAASALRRDTGKDVCKWAYSLPEGHREMICEIRMPYWDVVIETLAKQGFGGGVSLKAIQLMAIPELKRGMMYLNHFAGGVFLVFSSLKVDFKMVDGEMVWKSMKELDDFYYGF